MVILKIKLGFDIGIKSKYLNYLELICNFIVNIVNIRKFYKIKITKQNLLSLILLSLQKMQIKGKDSPF